MNGHSINKYLKSEIDFEKILKTRGPHKGAVALL